jgi:hypothetical protein
MMTDAQHAVIAQLLRSREPSRTAARLVLVDGLTPTAAAAETGITQQAVSNVVGRYKAAHALILAAYGAGAKRRSAPVARNA